MSRKPVVKKAVKKAPQDRCAPSKPRKARVKKAVKNHAVDMVVKLLDNSPILDPIDPVSDNFVEKALSRELFSKDIEGMLERIHVLEKAVEEIAKAGADIADQIIQLRDENTHLTHQRNCAILDNATLRSELKRIRDGQPNSAKAFDLEF